MGYSDREETILSILQKTPTVDVKSLTKTLYVSEATLRRDLKKLEEKGLIVRSHGKIVNTSIYADKNEGFDIRLETASLTKKRIGNAVVKELVCDGDVVFLDASTTALCAVDALTKKNDVIVITSGIKTLTHLSKSDIKFYSTGGLAINSSYSFVGQTAIDTVKTFNANIAIISCHGLSASGYATDTSERENDVRRAMLNQSRRKVLLIDSSKINKGYWHNLADISVFDDVYCDQELPKEIQI